MSPGARQRLSETVFDVFSFVADKLLDPRNSREKFPLRIVHELLKLQQCHLRNNGAISLASINALSSLKPSASIRAEFQIERDENTRVETDEINRHLLALCELSGDLLVQNLGDHQSVLDLMMRRRGKSVVDRCHNDRSRGTWFGRFRKMYLSVKVQILQDGDWIARTEINLDTKLEGLVPNLSRSHHSAYKSVGIFGSNVHFPKRQLVRLVLDENASQQFLASASKSGWISSRCSRISFRNASSFVLATGSGLALPVFSSFGFCSGFRVRMRRFARYVRGFGLSRQAGLSIACSPNPIL